MNFRKIVSSIGIGAGAVILGLGVQYAAAQWTAAPSTPPGNNVAAPINVSSTSQAKAGFLSIGTTTPPSTNYLDVEGAAYIQGLVLGQNGGPALQILDGHQASGTVLTSDANGKATWQSPGGAVPHGIVSYTTAGTYSWTAPAGVTSINVMAVGGGGGVGWTGGFGGNQPAVSAGPFPSNPASYVESILPVTPGVSYTVVVGSGGSSVHTGNSGFDPVYTGANGNPSSFTINGSQYVSAAGGSGGNGNGNSNNAASTGQLVLTSGPFPSVGASGTLGGTAGEPTTEPGTPGIVVIEY